MKRRRRKGRRERRRRGWRSIFLSKSRKPSWKVPSFPFLTQNGVSISR